MSSSKLAFVLLTGLAAGLIAAVCYAMYLAYGRVSHNDHAVDLVALIGTLLMAFRDVISKMGEMTGLSKVEVANSPGNPVPTNEAPAPLPEPDFKAR